MKRSNNTIVSDLIDVWNSTPNFLNSGVAIVGTVSIFNGSKLL